MSEKASGDIFHDDNEEQTEAQPDTTADIRPTRVIDGVTYKVTELPPPTPEEIEDLRRENGGQETISARSRVSAGVGDSPPIHEGGKRRRRLNDE